MTRVRTYPIFHKHSRDGWSVELQRSTVELPRCVLLRPTDDAPKDALGAALVYQSRVHRPGRTTVTVVAHDLLDPSHYGPFDSYEALAYIPQVITWRWTLDETAEAVPTWAGSFTEITATLTKRTHFQVRPVDLNTGSSGPIVLSATLKQG